MTTPAPLAHGRNRSNDTVTSGDGTTLSPQKSHHQAVVQRQLKSSKSADGLRRNRSRTMDPPSGNLRRTFEDLHVNQPSLPPVQLNAYESSEHSVPSHQNGKGNQSQHHDGSSIYQDQNQQRLPLQASQPLPHSTAPTQSPYQSLNVQTSQIASRSTPKLTFIPQTASQSNYVNGSKETRSFNGSSEPPESKSKSKTFKPKPIVLVENTSEDDVERDQYGFKKESQWLSHHDFVIFETSYIPIMERRRQKWAIFMNDSQGELPPRSAKLKRYIRKGIPPALRGEAWFHYSGAEDKCRANPGLFRKLVAQATANGAANEYAEVIERDLHRTFPENINFKSQITQRKDGGTQLSTENVAAIQSLRRVLLAFSLYCPSIGYCQSLNYIAGMLLLFMNEEQSFWTLAVITQNFLPEGMYDVTMEGANIDQAVLMTLVMERIPTLWSKFSNGATSVDMDEGPGLPTVTLVTSHWFLTLFINILPVESILRVWDCFFYEGRKILFRVALTILRLHESEIAKVDDPMEVFQVVQNIPKRLIDCHKLMEICFRRLGSFDLTTKEIDRRYDQFRAKRKSARAAAQASRALRDKK
ncbi:hypothetical protein BGX31_004573 [Mortierella sp. GBA43]|nr:hypothetical protein BGX31_004573 [Mortierella sp. GBA43]